jgi:hypothetical protein
MMTYAQIAQEAGLPADILRKRCYRGMSLENAIAMGPPKDNHRAGRKNSPTFDFEEHKGLTLTEISRITGVNQKTIRKRLNAGWDIETAARTPIEYTMGRSIDDITIPIDDMADIAYRVMKTAGVVPQFEMQCVTRDKVWRVLTDSYEYIVTIDDNRAVLSMRYRDSGNYSSLRRSYRYDGGTLTAV